MPKDEHGLDDDSLRGSEYAAIFVQPGGAADVDRLEPVSVQEKAAADRLNRSSLPTGQTFDNAPRQPTFPGSGQASAEPAPSEPLDRRSFERLSGPQDRPAMMPNVVNSGDVDVDFPEVGRADRAAENRERYRAGVPPAPAEDYGTDPRVDVPGPPATDLDRGSPPSRLNLTEGPSDPNDNPPDRGAP